MKKILLIFIAVLLVIGLTVGFFALRFYFFKNGRVVLRGTNMCAVADPGYKFDSWSSGDENEKIPLLSLKNLFSKPNFEKEKLDLPIVSIDTYRKKKIKSKEVYVDCTVSLCADEELSFEAVSARIKGRGNSTFQHDKKPYKIKFDEKISVLGEGAAKEWTLIANHMDYSLVRNRLAYAVGAAIGLEYTTSANFVDVYLNGEYLGVYLLCEQIETGKNRVDIEDSLEVDETGYLIELDARAPDEGEEGIDYFYSKAASQPYGIKSPDTEDVAFTADRVEFIKNYVDSAYDALLGTDYSAVCNYLDVDSFVNGYILDELFKTTDVGFSSFYLYKDAGGKLFRGPIWDYDLSAGNSIVESAAVPNSIYAGAANPWYARLLTFPEFREAVGKRLVEVSEEISFVIDSEFKFFEDSKASFERNFVKWDILGECSMEYTSQEVCELKTFDEQLSYLKNWLEESLTFVNVEYVK